MTDAQTSLAPPRTWLRRITRHCLRIGAGVGISLLILAAVLYFWAKSSSGKDFIRKTVAARIQALTGGQVEIGAIHWIPLELFVEADNIVIHGKEAAGEAPYAAVGQLRARLSVLGILSPHIKLHDLQVVHPAFHLIVYRDGSTNQPHPQNPRTSNKPLVDTLFDFQAGHVSVEQGVLHYEGRASSFDFQNRLARLDFDADDVSLRLAYNAAAGRNPESYRIEAGASQLNLARGEPAHSLIQPTKARLQATLDLLHSAAYLRALSITAYSKGIPDRTLNVTGELIDFNHPQWRARATGQLDMRLLEPLTGYPDAPEGIANLDLTAEGHEGAFRADGPIHVDGGAYLGSNINARGIRLDAKVHADPEELLISSIVAHLKQGGDITGQVTLAHWLATIPGPALTPAVPAPASKPQWYSRKQSQAKPAPPPPPQPASTTTIPVDGKVTAQFNNVSLDTILDIVSQPPFQRLGLDALLNGPAVATWNHGDTATLAVSTKLGMTPSAKTPIGEVPATGDIDGTYTQRDGAVDLRELNIAMPASRIEAHGHLGAYPISSPSAIALNFSSTNLAEFDPLLRDLGLQHNGNTGVSALPISLKGQAQFQGEWTGALRDPHLAGTLSTGNLAVQLPASWSTNGQPQTVQWDNVVANGSYSAARIAIDHAQLTQGPATISLQGSLTAAAPVSKKSPGIPVFDSNSLLQLHLGANDIDLTELLQLLGRNLEATGKVNAQLQVNGPIRTLDGSGTVELDQGVIYGEPIARVRAQGVVSGQVLHLSSVTVNDQTGKLSASVSFDMKSRAFQIDARGNDIALDHIQRLRNAGVDMNGKLSFAVSGSGTPDDPRLTAQSTITGMTISGEPMGTVNIAAHTTNRTAYYNLTTQFETASITANGQTALSGDYNTQARAEFSQFNIAAILKMAHLQGLTGESALAGTAAAEGPLAHPDQIRGNLNLQNLAVTLEGVHLKSEGPVQATMADSRVTLAPVHITGEETDLRAEGSLDLKQKRHLNFSASGSINLKLAETLDADVTATGTTTFQVKAQGPIDNPNLSGQIEFQNASLALEDLPNSLSQLQGTLQFNQNRLEVKSLTARTGGGLLSVSGYMAYQHGLFADLSLSGKGVRIRYPEGISSQADATLRLQGTQNSLLLSGNVLITRFTISPQLDMTALATQASQSQQSVVAPNAPSNHVRLDVHIVSSPQLNFQNAYAKLAGDVDLHVRGTLASPSVQGRISILEGSATIAGTRYELQRGDITFTNPVRIEPIIDLNATARVEDYDITLGLHGTPPNKMLVTYRSDPPLPEADVVALLALGRTQDQERIFTQQQQEVTSNPTTDALLGGALNATVSSRVQKLFGAGSIKVDPNYLGVLGNSTTRITVEEQVGRYVTFTYATDVDTTAQQLLQAEIAINRHISLLVTRDESDVFSIVIKATRRYR